MTPFVIVIFGATGDLAQHKLLPALFNLFKNKQIGDPAFADASARQRKFYIVGFARREFSDEQYAHMLGDELEVHKDPEWKAFAKNIYYQQGLFDEADGYNALIAKLNGFDEEIGACITRVFYLATPPDNYETILQNLNETKLSEGCGPAFAEASAVAKAMADKTAGKQEVDLSKWTRMAIEKPFGKDLDTARALDKKIADIFEERQIFRVDHYLGKETVQNMIAFRFANSVFEPVWNKEHIDHVQITIAEKKGVEAHGRFFDGVGMLRDVAQNHLLQLLATVAMEQPFSFTRESVRDERAKAIKAIRPIPFEEVSKYTVKGQYEGFRLEKNVNPESNTDSFAAMKLFVDTKRFADVPFYLRAGKAMEQNLVDIKVVFKQTCHLLFKEYGCPEIGNVLTIRIQPDEGITLRVITKQPGSKLGLATVDMNFSYHQAFGGHGADAYEKILTDILIGDQMLFNRSDELESSWQLISNIRNGWKKENKPVPQYEKGSWGPQEAFTLIEKDGRKWL